ncbi:MAG: nuclear transport factor 2 family protein [Actinomycetota bacterium]
MGLTLEDRLAIQDLYSAYNHAIDHGRAEDFGACFTADGSLDTGWGDPTVGTAALVAFVPVVNQAMPGMRHSVSNLLIEGDGDDATGRAYLYSYRAGVNGHEVVLTGVYHDTIRRVDGAWRFVTRTVAPDLPPAG